MKIFTLILFSIVSVSPVFAGEPFEILIVRPAGETLRIQRVTTSKIPTGILVHGRVTASRVQYLPAGHVDIAAYAPDGVLIAEATAMVCPPNLSRQAKRKGGVRFSGEVDGVFPAGTTIKLVYHRAGTCMTEPDKTAHESFFKDK